MHNGFVAYRTCSSLHARTCVRVLIKTKWIEISREVFFSFGRKNITQNEVEFCTPFTRITQQYTYESRSTYQVTAKMCNSSKCWFVKYSKTWSTKTDFLKSSGQQYLHRCKYLYKVQVPFLSSFFRSPTNSLDREYLYKQRTCSCCTCTRYHHQNSNVLLIPY